MLNHLLPLQPHSLTDDQVNLLFRNIRGSLIGLLPLTLIFLYLFRQSPINELVFWLSFLGCAVAAEYWLILRFNQRQDNTHGYRWAWLMSLCSFLAALSLGLAVCRFVDFSDFTTAYLSLALLIFPVFGSAMVSAPFLPVHIGWTLGSILPIAFKLLLQHNETYFLFGLSLLTGGIPVALYLGWNFHQEIMKTLQLRLSNQQLLEEVLKKKESAEKANRQKSFFLAAASHDLRQPLHAIALYLGALEMELDNRQQQRIVDNIKQSHHFLSQLLNSLFEISRIDSGELTVNWRTCDLAEIIANIINQCRNEADQKKLSLVNHVRRVFVHSDPELLGRIISNLLNNAITYTEKGRIVLGARHRNAKIIFFIKDTGCGIPDQELDNIFSEFYQLNNPQRDHKQGIGLGLAIVKRLAALLGTEIHVYSKPGKGSLFWFSIDKVDRQLVTPTHQQPSSMLSSFLKGRFIILIDDDADSLQALRLLNKGWGCEVLAVNDGRTAIETLQNPHYETPDLIISDFRLPGLSGLDTIQAIRNLYHQTIPALIISGDIAEDIEFKAQKMHCSYARKPLSAEQLKEKAIRLIKTGSDQQPFPPIPR